MDMSHAAGKDGPDYPLGDKLYQEPARAALPLLVRQATQAHSPTVFYAALAAELGMPN
jgi:hypothetical protein